MLSRRWIGVPGTIARGHAEDVSAGFERRIREGRRAVAIRGAVQRAREGTRRLVAGKRERRRTVGGLRGRRRHYRRLGRSRVDPERTDVRRVAPAPGGTNRPQVEPPGAVGNRRGETRRPLLDILRHVGRGGRARRPGIGVAVDIGAAVPIDDDRRLRGPTVDSVARAPQRRIGWRCHVDLERAEMDWR